MYRKLLWNNGMVRKYKEGLILDINAINRAIDSAIQVHPHSPDIIAFRLPSIYD